MKIKRLMVAAIMPLWLNFNSMAQENLQADVKNILKTYIANDRELRCTVTYTYFTSKRSVKPVDEKTGELCTWNGNYIFNFLGTEVIKNQQYYVMANFDSKSIWIGHQPGSMNTSMGWEILDSLIKTDAIKMKYLKSGNSDNKTIRVVSSILSCDSMDLKYKTNDYTLLKYTLYFNPSTNGDSKSKGPVLCMTYNNTTIKQPSSKDKEKYYGKKYVEVTSKKVLLKQEYKSYKLIDNLFL